MRLSKSLSCDQMDKDNEKEGDEEGLKSPKIGRRSTLSQITTLMRNFKMNVSDSSSRSKRSTKFSALDRNTKGMNYLELYKTCTTSFELFFQEFSHE